MIGRSPLGAAALRIGGATARSGVVSMTARRALLAATATVLVVGADGTPASPRTLTRR